MQGTLDGALYGPCRGITSEPKRALVTEIDPVKPAIDVQGCAEPTWAPCQISQPLGAAVLLHDADAVRWLDCSDQDACANARPLARDVQHERAAIGKVDICVPALEEERLIARGDATIGVTRGVADGICLGLDDAAARHTFGQLPHEHLADEKTSELRGIDRQLSPMQPDEPVRGRRHAPWRRG